MRNIIISFGLLAASSVAAAAETPIMTALEPWEPLHAQLVDETLVVVLPLHSVNNDAFTAVIRSGLCAPARAGSIDLDGVAEIAVANRHGAAGLIFEGGAAECEELAEFDGDAVNIQILGRSHGFSRTGNPYRF